MRMLDPKNGGVGVCAAVSFGVDYVRFVGNARVSLCFDARFPVNAPHKACSRTKLTTVWGPYPIAVLADAESKVGRSIRQGGSMSAWR